MKKRSDYPVMHPLKFEAQYNMESVFKDGVQTAIDNHNKAMFETYKKPGDTYEGPFDDYNAKEEDSDDTNDWGECQKWKLSKSLLEYYLYKTDYGWSLYDGDDPDLLLEKEADLTGIIAAKKVLGEAMFDQVTGGVYV